LITHEWLSLVLRNVDTSILADFSAEWGLCLAPNSSIGKKIACADFVLTTYFFMNIVASVE
jgi:hypothetical protein